MLKKVTEAINRFRLIKDAKHITVALSGGADSMALLYALLELKCELGLEKISAAHFNHQIRGDEAVRDQSFVAERCKELDVELMLGEADVPEYARRHKMSVELAARKLRYEFLNSLDTDLVATAHTASDNMETVLFNLTRGTALSGLCGIPSKRDRYIRPLILCTREDVENYCSYNSIDFVNDSSNFCDDYTRNKIRHNVTPVLKQINESAENAVLRMTISLREDEHFINGVVSEKYKEMICEDGITVENFDQLHPSIAKRVISRFCSANSLTVDNFHINAVYSVCLHGGKTSLPHDKAAIVENGVLKIDDAKVEVSSAKFSVDVNELDNDLFENVEKVNNLLLKNILDCDKIVGKLVLRHRLSGDSIRLKNKGCTKTLKKLFCEYKIPAEERENLPVLADDKGIVWVYKIGVAERCAADYNSKRIYKINVKKLF